MAELTGATDAEEADDDGYVEEPVGEDRYGLRASAGAFFASKDVITWFARIEGLIPIYRGQYEVSVVGCDYEADGTDGVAREISATRTITVETAPAIDTQFTATATSVASSARIRTKY